MRMTFALAALLILAVGAAAPKKAAEKPASQPSTASQLFKDLRPKMSEAEAVASLEKAGTKVTKREEKEKTVYLTLDDKRRLVFKEDKLTSITRDTMAETPAELQTDAKVGMSEAEATAEIQKAGRKIVSRNTAFGGTVLQLDDGRGVVIRDDKVISIQRPHEK